MKFKCLSTNKLKIIAMIAMTFDHIGAALLPQHLFIRSIFRIAGRLAMPVFCYLIVIGLFATKDIRKYLTRLLIFALISEIPFDLAFHNTIIEFRSQNVFFTLMIGLFVIWLIEKEKMFFLRRSVLLSNLFELLILCTGCAIAYFLKTDYTFFGVLMIYFFYECRFHAILSILAQTAVYVLMGGIEVFAVFALVPICMYNGEKGKNSKILKWCFYAYYPCHLLLIYMVRTFL